MNYPDHDIPVVNNYEDSKQAKENRRSKMQTSNGGNGYGCGCFIVILLIIIILLFFI